MNTAGTQDVRFGHTRLPDEVRSALHAASRLEWITIGYLAVTVTLVFLVLGNSQAMRAAWVEDLLSFLPPIAFLIAGRVVRLRPSLRHPYGFHRATGIAHLVAAVSLLIMGLFLVVESGIALLMREHPTIGGVTLFGATFWLGWLMVGTLALTAVPPVLLGRAKLRQARILHDKVLYADADMNKADWMTAVAGMVGVLGIGIGWWWADATAALVIAVSISKDGGKNLRTSVRALMDARAMTFDDAHPHPLIGRVDDYLRSLDWVADARSRARDEGHVFHIESFVVPSESGGPWLDQLEGARLHCIDLDWKIQDMVIVPVRELPDEFLPGITTGGER